MGTKLGGAGDKIDLVPMATRLNRRAYLKMKNDIARDIPDPNIASVSIKIDVAYPPTDTATPNAFFVTKIVDGVPQIN